MGMTPDDLATGPLRQEDVENRREPTLSGPLLTDWQGAIAHATSKPADARFIFVNGNAVLAVARRLAWLESERERLVEENRRLYAEIERWQSFDATQTELAMMERHGE